MLVDEKFRIGALIDKANESLSAAEVLIENGHYDEAVLRCYHAVFFVLRAFLKKKEVPLEKTSDSLAVFKKHFIDTNEIPAALYSDVTAVIDAAGFGNSEVMIRKDKALIRGIYEKADRFFNDMSDLI